MATLLLDPRRAAWAALCAGALLGGAAARAVGAPSPVRLVSAPEPALVADTAATASTFGFGVEPLGSQVSADGRFVVYVSQADDLVPGQPAGDDGAVYLFDRVTGVTTLVSHRVGSLSTPANGASAAPVISADGSKVVFTSTALDVVPGQSCSGCMYDTQNVFLYDRVSGVTALVSHLSGSPAASEPTSRVAVLSADGRYVAFESEATHLLPGVTVEPGQNVYLFDSATGAISLVSHNAFSSAVAAKGDSFAPSISADGSYVAFLSDCSDLVAAQTGPLTVNAALYDRTTGVVTLVSHNAVAPRQTGNGHSSWVVISADGSSVVYISVASDLVAGQRAGGGGRNAFVYDRLSGATLLASHAAASAVTNGNAETLEAAVSADGRTVAFTSGSTDLVAGFTGGASLYNVFIFDKASGAVTLVSHRAAAPAAAGDDNSGSAVLSADGRFVAFGSGAHDLVAGQAAAAAPDNVYLFDRTTATMTLVSHAPEAPLVGAGGDPAELSADGAFVYFVSTGAGLVAGVEDANGAEDLFVYDREAGSNRLVTRRDPSLPSASAGQESFVGGPPSSAVSDDGRFVVFTSYAPNLVAGQVDLEKLDLARESNVFLYDRETGARSLVSHAPGSPGTPMGPYSWRPLISGNGRYVAFTNVLGVLGIGGTEEMFLYDRLADASLLASHDAGSPTEFADCSSEPVAISASGRWVLFVSCATDLVTGQVFDLHNLSQQLFLFDRVAGTTALVSHNATSAVTPCNREIGTAVESGDGRWVAFVTTASDVVPGQSDPSALGMTNVFLYDRVSGVNILVSHAAASPTTVAFGWSYAPSISDDGRFLAFESTAGDLPPGMATGTARNVYLFDRVTGAMTLVSRPGAAAPPAGGESFEPVLSADGRTLAFLSTATGLVPGVADTNQGADVFLYDRVAATLTLVSHAAGTVSRAADGPAGVSLPAISADGRFVAYLDAASDLVAGQLAAVPDSAYLYDRVTGANTLVSRSAASPLAPAALGVRGTLSDIGVRGGPWLSATGGTVVFSSVSPDLVAGDRNEREDVFVFDAAGSYNGLPAAEPPR